MRPLIFIALLCSAAPALAITTQIDFEGNRSGTSYSEKGFLFSTDSVSGLVQANGQDLRNGGLGLVGIGSETTSVFWGWGPDTTDGTLTMDNTLGVAFDLLSIDAGDASGSNNESDLLIVGTLFGGGTISRTLSVATDIATYDLSSLGLTGLSRVDFIIDAPNQFPPVEIDNIGFSASVVPIPAAAWLFGSALAGLGWMRRKQAG